jgi:hypothetical protein
MVWLAGRGRYHFALGAGGSGWAGVPMSVSDVIEKIVSFLRGGYPQGVPATDTFALLALLRRRLSDPAAVR